MKNVIVREARTNLYKLWRAIQETQRLRSIPGMRASIRKGMKTPIEECLESVAAWP